MIDLQAVSCRLSIGLKSGDSIPNLTRHEPDRFYGVFSNIVGGRQLADSLKILCFLSVSCRFGRCDYDLAYIDIRISVGLWSICCRFVIGLGLSVCSRLRVQHCANDRFSIGVMSVIYRSEIGRFHTESTRQVVRCLQQHCRWPTAGRYIENVVFFVGFVSVWPVWLGY